MIECRCPACGRQAVLPDEDAGRKYRCDCGNVNLVPGAAKRPADAKGAKRAEAGGPGAGESAQGAQAAQGVPAVVYEGRPSQLENFWFFVLLGVIVILLGVLVVKCRGDRLSWMVTFIVLVAYGAWLGHRMLALRCTKYTVTVDNVTIEEGIVSKSVDNIDLFRANDVDLEQSGLQRMLGIGDVTIESTDRTMPTAVLRNVLDPRAVFEKVRKAAAEADQRRGVIQVER